MKNEFRQNLTIQSVTWINSADTKATALLTIYGALAALTLATNSFPSVISCNGEFIGFLSYFSGTLLGIICSIFALNPRLNRKSYIMENPSDLFIFDLAKLSFENFESKLNRLSKKQIINENEQQLYSLCKIASIKMKWVKRSILFFSLIAFGFFLIILNKTIEHVA
ncbi:hypothetical protein EHQ47_16765 [Leptospira bourretii]|uniref:Pycsar system effector family protein n=1 Tax=Leptospira bourretii TaxID=2484962 RepID=UPI00109122E2|nr:Pycsar system effector family protein [Leptospira bourretii]TGL19748.1 hypothetical protein EHQ47_16765 [Leptospira bourretii]